MRWLTQAFVAAGLLFVVSPVGIRAADKPADKPAEKSAGQGAEKAVGTSAPGKPEKRKVAWHSLFDGKKLGEWKPSKFDTQGTIDVKDGQIVIGFGDGCSGVTWTGKFPKTDYEIRLQAKRIEGDDFFCGLTFPVGKDPCSFICGGWGGCVVGLSSIDGEDASSNDTSKVKNFEKGKWYTIRVRVTKSRISAWIDNEQFVDQPLADRKITIRSSVEPSRPLGIASYKTTAAVRHIEWRKLGEK